MDDNKIEEVLNSLDGAERAVPRPFLLTRINARLQQKVPVNFWGAAFAFISRPLVAGIGLLLFLMVNVIIISRNKNTAGSNIVIQNTNTAQYEFAINVASIYDIENQ